MDSVKEPKEEQSNMKMQGLLDKIQKNIKVINRIRDKDTDSLDSALISQDRRSIHVNEKIQKPP